RVLDLLDEAGEPHARGFALDRVADLVLEAGISVDDVPAGHKSWWTLLDGGRAGLPREQAEQELDQRREEGVDAEEEDGEQGGHDHDHDRGGDGFLAGRPVDALDRLDAYLPHEFAGGDFGHRFGSPAWLR